MRILFPGFLKAHTIYFIYADPYRVVIMILAPGDAIMTKEKFKFWHIVLAEKPN